MLTHNLVNYYLVRKYALKFIGCSFCYFIQSKFLGYSSEKIGYSMLRYNRKIYSSSNQDFNNYLYMFFHFCWWKNVLCTVHMNTKRYTFDNCWKSLHKNIIETVAFLIPFSTNVYKCILNFTFGCPHKKKMLQTVTF